MRQTFFEGLDLVPSRGGGQIVLVIQSPGQDARPLGNDVPVFLTVGPALFRFEVELGLECPPLSLGPLTAFPVTLPRPAVEADTSCPDTPPATCCGRRPS